MADKYNYLCSVGERIEAKWLTLCPWPRRESWFQNHCLNLSHGWGKTLGILAGSAAPRLWPSFVGHPLNPQ